MGRKATGASTENRSAYLVMAQFSRIFELPWERIFRRAYQKFRGLGLLGVCEKNSDNSTRYRILSPSYGRWIILYDAPNRRVRRSVEADIARLPSRPIISIVIPISGGDQEWLGEAPIRSVHAQLYPHWECVSLSAIRYQNRYPNSRTPWRGGTAESGLSDSKTPQHGRERSMPR